MKLSFAYMLLLASVVATTVIGGNLRGEGGDEDVREARLLRHIPGEVDGDRLRGQPALKRARRGRPGPHQVQRVRRGRPGPHQVLG